MLGRKLTGSASFVCLRCRLQLAGAPNRIPFPALTSTASLRNPRRYQWTQANFFGEDEPKDRLADDKNAESRFSNEPNWDDDADLWANSRNDDMGASRSPPPPRPLRHPRNRTYKTRGHFVSPEHEGLSIDILGKPGGAIVLRETRAIEKRARPPALVLDADNGPIDPASLLAAAIVGSASEDILLNIHELKPETLILTEKEFNKLKGTLVKGFTSAQLGLYLREHQQAGRFVQEEAETVDEHPWILERHPWAPIFANVTQEVDSHLVGYIFRGMAPKERLAIRLMRECWDVSSQKVLDKDGHVSLQLRDVEFSLLTRT